MQPPDEPFAHLQPAPTYTPAPEPARPKRTFAGPDPGPSAPTSGLAIASMVSGVVGLGCTPVAILAAVLGHLALRETTTGERAGHALAIAGMVLGYLVIGLAAVTIIVVAVIVAAGT